MPQHLSEITLEQVVDFYNLYGRELDRRYKAILDMPEDSDERADAYMLYSYDSAMQHYSFYTGEALDELIMLDDADKLVEANKAMCQWEIETPRIFTDEVFEFAGWHWRIVPPVTVGKELTYAEFETVTDIALIFSDLQDGRIEALYELCAGYLRKLDADGHPEPSEATYDEVAERVELMKQLPVNIALTVKLFVEQSIAIYNAGRNRVIPQSGEPG